jgi:hypothetical protein
MTPKVTGSIKPSVSYGMQANTFASAPTQEKTPEPRSKTVAVFVEQIKEKIEVVVKSFLESRLFQSPGAIFGTIYSSKSFLTATSRLFINKTVDPYFYKTALGMSGTVGGFLIILGGEGKWQI